VARKNNRNRPVAPDEYYSLGPIEMARFGRMVVTRSNITAEQRKKLDIPLAARLTEIEGEIDALVEAIAVRIVRLPGDRLLARAWWEMAATLIMGSVRDAEEAGQLRMIDYVQSIIASVPPSPEREPDVSDEGWAALKTDVAKLFSLVTTSYQLARTAKRRIDDPELDMELEEFRFKAETLWMHVRGKRYQNYELQALEELLSPHSDELVKLFGIDAASLVAECGKIQHKLTAGAGEAMLALKKLHEDSIPVMEEVIASGEVRSVSELRARLWDDPTLVARRDAAVGEAFGMDLFDVAKVTDLPMALIDELAWVPGEDSTFFAPGPMRGWPLRIWPVMKRPFIRIDGRTLCFDLMGLFDNLYRVLQRTVFRLDSSYKALWNDRQKEVSEDLPFRYLEQLLPGMTEHRSVCYRWQVPGQKARWYETDGIIAYDDHLFVVEVKGGSFTYTSPADDLPGHMASLGNLLANPALQGSRFVDYLQGAPEVALFNEEQVEIGHLRRGDYRHVTVLAITLDPFTELAARAQQLKAVGIDVGPHAVWALSLDDLRVYANMFNNPLSFLHYVEQRLRAARTSLVDLNDEFDHFGLYLQHNDYARYAKEIAGGKPTKLTFGGYREIVDDFHAAAFRGEDPDPPMQPVPPRLIAILEHLSKSCCRGRSGIAAFFLDMAGDLREEVENAIEIQLAGNRRLGRPRPASIEGDRAFTLFCWSPPLVRDRDKAADFTRTAGVAHGQMSRMLIELMYDSDGRLIEVDWQEVGTAHLSASAMLSMQHDGAVLRHRRVETAASAGKLKVNGPCPCGSGLKFKRCCRS